jgi:hypothetical protein
MADCRTVDSVESLQVAFSLGDEATYCLGCGRFLSKSLILINGSVFHWSCCSLPFECRPASFTSTFFKVRHPWDCLLSTKECFLQDCFISKVLLLANAPIEQWSIILVVGRNVHHITNPWYAAALYSFSCVVTFRIINLMQFLFLLFH